MVKKDKGSGVVLIIMLVAIFLLFKGGYLGALTGNEVVTRTMPSRIAPSSVSSINYSISGLTTEQWPVTVSESVLGGCTIGDAVSTNLTKVFSSASDTLSIVLNVPASNTTCTLTGTYAINGESAASFSTLTSKICTTTCIRPADVCVESSTVSDTGCGGVCTGAWTVPANCSITPCVANNTCQNNTCQGKNCTDSCGNIFFGTKTTGNCSASYCTEGATTECFALTHQAIGIENNPMMTCVNHTWDYSACKIPASNNTIWYVLGGVAVIGAVLYFTRKKR